MSERQSLAGGMRQLTRDGGRRGVSVLTACVAGLAVLYAPIALTSMWFAFEPGAPRLQERLDAWVSGDSYATGHGSVAAVRATDYVDHRLVMLVHTVLGGLALLLAALQLVAVSRARRHLHRLVGRAYFALMTASMAAALVFLVVSPQVPVVGQVAFRWQLWVLALSTLGSAWLALSAARRGDVVAHRAWMALNIAFMLTAPVLRLTWTVLGPLFPEHDMLTNLEVGAVVLAVAAPAGGALVLMLQGASRRGPDLPAGRGLASRRRYVALAGLGCALVVVSHPGEAAGPAGYPWFHVAPVLGLLVICGIGERRTRGGESESREWEALVLGVALAPWAAILVGVAAATSIGATEAYLAGLMVAPGVPIVAAFGWIVGRRARAEHRGVEASVTVTAGQHR
ncbi:MULTISPECIES: DUF2306 domain-containing protein [Nocardioides]|uniref:DUF2306 domain-containing protein n=1 Tax=Nocardioides vastitatis TaxID=2568655 RepID=A0ABW0ZGL2_9ACTN|nr:DUF2306 domain-containing protein [Nocardioides sp.]THJ01705.1 DUF2306 domain-containing protein [Nocardioides sp.]